MGQEAEVGEVGVLLVVAEGEEVLRQLPREHQQETQPARQHLLPREQRRLRPAEMLQNNLAPHDEGDLLPSRLTQKGS